MDIFCKITNKETSADIVMESDKWLAINDIHPQTPVHILIIPKEHIGNLVEAKESHTELLGELILAANKIADKVGLKDGFRLIINQGENGGQLVPHLHIHLLGGRHLGPKIVNEK